MLEHVDEPQDYTAGRRRLVNTVSLLVPAKQYKLICSWTTERPLPAVEEFACRLILLFDGVTPFEVGEYFGLSEVELDGLLDSLMKKGLIALDPEGLIQPSSVLRVKTRGTEGVPNLTTYETREETAVFDLLTLSIMPRRTYQGIRHGLPEIPPPLQFSKIAPERIVEQFGKQYRAHLENSRTRNLEIQKTRLYKVSDCRPERTVQVPIDLQISMEVVSGEEIKLYRDAVERLGEIRKRALSNELEAQVADYLGQLAVPDDGLSFQDFHEAVGDEVLARHCQAGAFNLAAWLNDRDARKTGYGTPDTRGLLGPVYLENNTTTVCKTLSGVLKERAPSKLNAYWYAAHVPLWAANGPGLTHFVERFGKELQIGHESEGSLIALFNPRDAEEKKQLTKTFNARLPHGVALWGELSRDRVELFVVPGVLAVAQYHVQPSSASSVTVPIGYLTTNPERIVRIENLLRIRTEPARNSEILWSKTEASAEELLDGDLLRLTRRQPGKAPVVRWKNSRGTPQ